MDTVNYTLVLTGWQAHLVLAAMLACTAYGILATLCLTATIIGKLIRVVRNWLP